MKEHEVTNFIKNNSYFIYEYINKEVLKDIGSINHDYFTKEIEDILKNKIEIKQININTFPYFIFTLLAKQGKLDYTSLRAESINLNSLNKESCTYYNYVHFFIKKDIFTIALMQSKIGGMPIDEDIVKFKKEVIIKSKGLEDFIKECK